LPQPEPGRTIKRRNGRAARFGHACGYNLVAMAGVGIALALRAALEKHDVPGTIVLLGTPGPCLRSTRATVDLLNVW